MAEKPKNQARLTLCQCQPPAITHRNAAYAGIVSLYEYPLAEKRVLESACNQEVAEINGVMES